jgi:hypothetical protein
MLGDFGVKSPGGPAHQIDNANTVPSPIDRGSDR